MSSPKTMPDLFKRTRQDWLDECRNAARKLLGTQLSITVEDVLKVCPRPKFLHPNTTGSIFQHEDFVAEGFTLAKKPSSNGRVIRTWTLR